MATKIQMRRDTSANWASNNPILSNGELALSTDLGKFKVGNGSSNWSDLPYFHNTVAEDASALALKSNLASPTFTGVPAAPTASVDTNTTQIATTEFVVGQDYAKTTGNVATATALQTARVINLSGDVSGSVSFNGSASVDIATQIQPDSVALGADTTGNYVTQVTGSGDGISVTGSGESASVVIENTGVTALTGTANEVEISASTGSVTIGLPDSVSISQNLTVGGNLTVSGSVTYIDTETLMVEDKNIEMGVVAEPTDTTANGGGITLKGTTDKTINWIDATDSWTSSEHFDLANGKVYKINAVEVLSASAYVGNAATASALQTARAIALSGDVSGSVSFDGSSSVTISTAIQPDSVALGTDTTGNYVATVAGTASQVTVTGSGSENAAVTLSLPATINVDTSGNAATATKLATTRAIALTGDVTGTANFDGSASVGISSTLANSGVSASTYGSANGIPVLTVDAKGRITSASVSALDLSLYAPLASPTFTGTVSASVLSVSASSTLGSVTSGTWNATNIALGRGGTNASLTAENGAVVYSTESALALTSVGTAGQVLTSNGAGAPTWQAPSGGGGLEPFFLSGM